MYIERPILPILPSTNQSFKYWWKFDEVRTETILHKFFEDIV